jgi:hypothetical protein
MLNLFNKNVFSLNNKVETDLNKSKEDCSIKTIEKDYAGFSYKGDYNKCYLYESDEFNKKIDNQDYNVSTFIKNASLVSLDPKKNQHDMNNYFIENNNNLYIPNNFINKHDVFEKNDCMKKCYNNDKCKTALYFEQPKECIFYSQKIMKNYKNTDEGKIYDIYTIKKDVNKDLKNITKKDFKNIQSETNEHGYTEVKYKCDDKYSTNPFCTKEYDVNEVLKLKKIEENKNYSDCYELNNVLDSYDEQNKLYTSYCKAKFGDEYGFDNKLEDNKNVLKCDNPNEIKVKCALNFDGQKLNIEPFVNNNACNGYSSGVNLFILITLCIFFIIIVIAIIFIYRLVYGYKKINKNSA